MNREMVGSWVILLLVGGLAVSCAAPPVIGTARARGSFYLDHAVMQGNATLFEGALMETTINSSQLRLDGGARLQVAPASRGRVFSDRLVLEQGQGELQGSQGYRLETTSLHIVTDSPGSIARVVVKQPDRVAVEALSGAVKVTTREGTLLAKVESGRALEFSSQSAGAAAPVNLTGCLTVSEGHYFLRDEVANVTFELLGKDLATFVGHRVTVAATNVPAQGGAPGATQVLQAVQIKSLGRNCPASGAAGGPGARSKTGMSGTSKAVIAGVVIAAVASGTTIGLTRGQNEPSNISR